MLKSGFFQTPTEFYTIYEINEPGFYRLDLIKGNATFQIDFNEVAFSLVRKKKTYTIGDAQLYDTYIRTKTTIESAQMESEKESEWIDGAYTSTVHSRNEKFGFTLTTRSVNGNIVDTTYTSGEYSIHLFVSEPIYGVKLEPINFIEYSEISLSNDTVKSEKEEFIYYTAEVLKRRYDLKHLEDYDLKVVTDIKEARERLHQFKLSKCPIKSFDTETTGLDVTMYGEDHVVGLVLGADKKTATYFPFRHKGDFNLPISFMKEVMSYVIAEQDHMVGHNTKFDREAMLKEGFDVQIKFDTLQIDIILNPNPKVQKGAHALKTLISALLNQHFLELDEIFVDPRMIDFSVLTPEVIELYACTDCTDCIILLEDQFKRLPKYHYMLAYLECDLTHVKADQEYYGCRVDVKKYERQHENCNYILDMLIKAFRTLTKEDGNLNSNQVLSDLMYNKMRCPVLIRTKTGAASTSSNAIKKLASQKTKEPRQITEDLVDLYGNVVIKAKDLATSKYPALLVLSKYREYNKLKTAFYARFERTVKTGRIFFWVNQNGAATGRQSSPMHQLPPELKEVILSDAPDRDFWGPDYSQVEIRMIAYLAGEKELLELAKDPENDIHRIIGSLISGKEMWAITKEERSVGKRRNFGVIYLISARGLAGQIFGPGYTQENVDFCQKQLDEFYHKFKRIDRYIKKNAALVQERGYMETAWFHRVRRFDDIFDPDLEPRKRASILRMSNNVPVQGTAADYMKLAEVKMYKYIREKGWNKLVGEFPMVRMMLSIHDEIIISAHESIPMEEIITMIVECMETPVEDAAPFFTAPGRFDNWEGHNDDSLAMPIGLRDECIENYKKTGESIFKRSKFHVTIPDEVRQYINENRHENTKEQVEKIYQKCSMEFVSGDYVTTYTDKQLKDAVTRYVESNFDYYVIDNYREQLNSYRRRKLDVYMGELIEKYGTDYKIVGNQVRHPSLTHALIENYSKELKGFDGTHEELIVEATRLYIEEILNGPKTMQVVVTPTVTKASDRDLFTTQLEQMVNYDNEGNVIYFDETEEEDDIFDDISEEDAEEVIHRTMEDPQYVWEFADMITFDVQDLLPEDINLVLSYIFEHKEEEGFYKVNIIYKGDLVDTKMRMETVDIEEANKMVLSLLQKEVKNV